MEESDEVRRDEMGSSCFTHILITCVTCSLIFFSIKFYVAELGISCLSFFTCFELVFSGRICYCRTSIVYAIDGILYVGRLRLRSNDRETVSKSARRHFM